MAVSQRSYDADLVIIVCECRFGSLVYGCMNWVHTYRYMEGSKQVEMEQNNIFNY